MKIRRRETKKARIEIIPMIDVIFFLLVFFMVTSLSMTKVNGIQVALPKTASAAQSLRQKAILTIKKNGDILVNKMAVNLETVGLALADALKDNPQEAVLVNADEGANYGRVIQAMDKARIIGIRKFALATSPKAN